MTEVPDYLLERSKARRRALGLLADDDGGDAGGGGGTGGGGGGAVAATGGGGGGGATVLQPIPEKTAAAPAPPSPAVLAAKARSERRPPLLVGAAFSLMAVYLFVYVALLGEDTETEESRLAIGEELYGVNCAACHGAGGGGGVGQAFTGGAIVLTFPEVAGQFDFVRQGSITGEPYGDPDRPGGGRVAAGGMPGGWTNLTDAELYAVVTYEREVLGGEELDEEQIAERDELWEQLEGAETISDVLPEGEGSEVAASE